ncbi:MAG: hypothetical protein PVI80_12995 [Anaerolineae bacterium]|jgi:hypothetical protein
MSDPSKSDKKLRPYARSWVNHLTAWVERRRWPSWTFYLGLWLVLVVVQVATLWIEGVFPFPDVFPAQFFIPAMLSLFLAMIHYLDSRAEAALTTLQPALEATEEERRQLRYQLTTLPAWPTILSSVALVAVIFLLGVFSGESESSIEALAASPIAANLLKFVYYVGWWVFGAFLYHTIHQLGVINRIYAEHTRVHLFAMSPLYAFSGVTALTAVTLAIATYGWTALNPENLSDPISIVIIFFISILALVVFAWPLLGTRRILAREKAQWLDQISLRVEAVFSEIHQRIDDGAWEETEELTKVLALLETERDTLKGISTWPWSPDTLRLLITALGLPLLLWIIQYVLQFFLGS